MQYYFKLYVQISVYGTSIPEQGQSVIMSKAVFCFFKAHKCISMHLATCEILKFPRQLGHTLKSIIVLS